MTTVVQWLQIPPVAAGLRIAAVLIAAVLLTRLVRRGVRKMETKVAEDTTPLRALQRTHTLARVLGSAGMVAV